MGSINLLCKGCLKEKKPASSLFLGFAILGHKAKRKIFLILPREN